MNYVRTRLRPSTPEPAERTAEDESGERRNGPDDWSDESGGGDGSGRRETNTTAAMGPMVEETSPEIPTIAPVAAASLPESRTNGRPHNRYRTVRHADRGSRGERVDTVHLLAGGVADTDTPTYTLSIEADEATVHRVLESDPDVLEWEIASAETGVVYAYVRFRAPPGSARFANDSPAIVSSSCSR